MKFKYTLEIVNSTQNRYEAPFDSPTEITFSEIREGKEELRLSKVYYKPCPNFKTTHSSFLVEAANQMFSDPLKERPEAFKINLDSLLASQTNRCGNDTSDSIDFAHNRFIFTSQSRFKISYLKLKKLKFFLQNLLFGDKTTNSEKGNQSRSGHSANNISA